ncbi:MAG: DUF3795 domain-containing protein [Asgard group archaeon]|nr:DUF3795 domain-containing protein [Asgard group archaeon]
MSNLDVTSEVGGVYIPELDNISYCGNNCDYCGLRTGNFDKNIDDLKDILESFGINGDLKNLRECPGCRAGGLFSCQIRSCAIEKKIELCPTCESFFSCEKIEIDQSQFEMLVKLGKRS